MDQFTTPWVEDLAVRLWRQLEQTAAPVLTQVVTVGGQVDVKAAVVSLAGVEAVTVLKFVLLTLAGVTFYPDDPAWKRILERVLPAAAGVYSGLGVAQWADVLRVDWAHASLAAAAAALIALLSTRISPAPEVNP